MDICYAHSPYHHLALGSDSTNTPLHSMPDIIVQPKQEPRLVEEPERSNSNFRNKQGPGNYMPSTIPSTSAVGTPMGANMWNGEGNERNAERPVKEERTEEEIIITTEDLLHLHPRSKKRSYNIVPEDRKDEAYHANRLKNAASARKCRKKRRMIEEGRVAKIKELTSTVELLENGVKQLDEEKKKRIELEKQCDMYKKIIENLFARDQLASTITTNPT
ncbi:unnamed protein product [Orchesella dallaii]|uniref:BZIP domain-containing protein n=1 Tax=Orchesella dallaii TaxID=48710 RepID=A0ABP1Q1T7_9HEXA